LGKVSGIGGVFFRSDAGDELTNFYKDLFEINLGAWLHQDAGPSVIAPFKPDTEYFGPKSNQFMINLRVEGLDDFIGKLRALNVEELGYDDEEYGRFFRFLDPAGNAIELWEPPKGELPAD
jgi:predicted enzyme related to lactoylglutathione lyase